jgi:drug/metabolite transporter (DMT)-like permease
MGETSGRAVQSDVRIDTGKMLAAESSTQISRSWTTHVALLVVQLAFASQSVEGKIAMLAREAGGEGLDPPALAMMRMIGAAVIFQVISPLTGARRPLVWRDHARLAGLSVLGIVLNQTLFLLGLRLTSPVSAALLSVAIPVFTAALAVVFRLERLRGRLVVGLGVASAGIVWLTGVRDLDRGVLLVALNSLCYAAYLVFGRNTIRRLGALTVVTWVFTWGALIFAPVGLPRMVATVPDVTARGWAFIAFIIAVPTIVAYVANAWALGRSTASMVTAYISLQPLLSALLAWVQLGTVPSGRIAVAAVLILSGLWIVVSRTSRS